MSTVAWRGSTLASDSAVTQGNRQGRCTKLLVTRGARYGFAGDVSEIWHFIDRIEAGVALADIRLKGDFECLMLTPDGCFYMARDLRPSPIEDEFWAIGTGAEYAIGAMHWGKSAIQAVETAIKYDPHSSGDVRFTRIRRRRNGGR